MPRLAGGLLVLAVIGGGYWVLSSGGADRATADDQANSIAAAPTSNEPRSPVADRREAPSVIGANSAGTSATETPPRIDPRVQALRRSAAASGATNAPSPAPEPLPVPAEPVAEPEIQTMPVAEPPRPPAPTRAGSLLARGEAELASNRPISARDLLNRSLHDPAATEGERTTARRLLSEVAHQTVFEPRVIPGDPIVTSYQVGPGDSLAGINRDLATGLDWRFIQRINRIADPRRIRVGQTLKVVRGPMHAVVSKDSFRLDLYADTRDSDGNRVYLRSFDVGLGEYSSTPLGSWVVRERSKLINPEWVNPRTGQKFEADDPENPIGERWIGLEGTDEQTRLMSGYGIHGTIEPGSIGHEASMGCVRMLPDDVAMIYELLMPGASEVEIVQ
ncbi:MAG: L,D-transpeptidase family protein [Planctomycetota bacterium]